MSFGVAGRAVTGAAGAVIGVAVVLLPVSLVVPVVLVFLLLLSPLLVQVVVCATRSAPIDGSGSSSEICRRAVSIDAASLLAQARFHD